MTEPLLVARTLHLASGDAVAAAEALARLPGIVTATAEPGGRSVRVEYDLNCLRLAVLEQALAAAGAPVKRGLAAAWRRAVIRFTEDNLLANANAEPHCCCKPPKGK